MAKKDYLEQYNISQKNALLIFFKYKGFMKKRSQAYHRVKMLSQILKVRWVIWAAWADRITFEEIKKLVTGDLMLSKL